VPDLLVAFAFVLMGVIAMICSIAIGMALEKRGVKFGKVLFPALTSLFTAGAGIFLLGLHLLGVF